MADNEAQIRALIERWARAVHTGDLDGVLADHSDDIVMFDVPPPDDGVRGIDAYRETWPPFFKWQEQGASFEITSLEVHRRRRRRLRARPAALRDSTRTGTRPGQPPTSDDRLSQGTRPLDCHPRTPLVPGQGLSRDKCPRTRNTRVRQQSERWFEGTVVKDIDGVMSNIAASRLS